MSIKERIVNNPLSSRTIPIILSIWIIGLTAYYCINTPWLSFLSNGRPDTKELIAETLKFHWVPVFLSRFPYVFYALILNFIALLIGNRILRWLKVDFSRGGVTPPLPSLIFSIPLGWSVYSIGIFWLGISGLLYKEAVYCFLTLLGILSILEIKNVGATLAVAQNGAGARPAPTFSHFRLFASLPYNIDKTDLVFLPAIIIFIIVQLILSFSPVWSVDVLVYHMALPKLYIKHHSLVHVPGFFFSTLPAHTEMLYLLGLITSGETLSKLFSFSISSVFLISIFSFGNRYFSKAAGYLAVFIIMQASPFFSPYFTEPWTDTALGLFSLLGVYAFFMWIENRKEAYLYLSIICCAFAAATKIQGSFFVLLFFVGFFFHVGVQNFEPLRVLKKLAWCIFAVAIIALPWYIRSWWLTGDPIFPFLYKYLGAFASGEWNEYSNACFWEFHSEWKGTKSLSDFIRINKDLFFSGFGISSLPPIIVIFLIPVLIIHRGRRLSEAKHWNKSVRYLFFVALVCYIFFIFASPQIRYFYVGLVSLSIIVAHFIKTVWTKYMLTRVPILGIVAFSIVSFWGICGIIKRPFFAGLGVLDQRRFLNESPYEYLRESFSVATWVNENLPHNSKILSWQSRTNYYLNKDYVAVNPAFQGVLDFGKINDTQTFLKSIKELGITHLLFCNSDLTSPRGHVKEFLDKCVSELLEGGKITLIKQIDSCDIYRIEAE